MTLIAAKDQRMKATAAWNAWLPTLLAWPTRSPRYWQGPKWHMPWWRARQEQGQQAGDVATASQNLLGCVEAALGLPIQSHPLLLLCLSSKKTKLQINCPYFVSEKTTSTKPSSSGSILTIWNIMALPNCFVSFDPFCKFNWSFLEHLFVLVHFCSSTWCLLNHSLQSTGAGSFGINPLLISRVGKR